MLRFSDFEPRALTISKESSCACTMTGSACCLLAKRNLLLFAQSACMRFTAHQFIKIDLKNRRRAMCTAQQAQLCSILRMCQCMEHHTSHLQAASSECATFRRKSTRRRLRSSSFRGLARQPARRTAEWRRLPLMTKLVSMCRHNSHSRKSWSGGVPAADGAQGHWSDGAPAPIKPYLSALSARSAYLRRLRLMPAGRPVPTTSATCGVAVGNKDGAARRSVRSRRGRLCLGTSTTAGLNRGSGGSCDECFAANCTLDRNMQMMMIREI